MSAAAFDMVVLQTIALGDASGGQVATLASSADTRRVSYTSPLLGTHHYKYDSLRAAWVSELDDHFLIEMLARDLIHHCKGLPSF